MLVRDLPTAARVLAFVLSRGKVTPCYYSGFSGLSSRLGPVFVAVLIAAVMG